MSGPHIVAKTPLQIGTPLVVEGPSPEGDFAAVFEDDGETGYFYALDRERLSCKALAQRVPDTEVRRRMAARGTAEWRLIHELQRQ